VNPNVRLYFLFMTGCGACAVAKPVVKKWEKAHHDVQVVYVDLLTAKWVAPWQPKVTPTYVAEVPGHRRVMAEGALSADKIDKLLTLAQQA
jgi:hypothetical protein